MAFNFLKWILTPAGETSAGVSVSHGDFLDNETEIPIAGLEIYLQRMAFWAIVRKIGHAVGAVEWETYRRGKKVKAREHWSWNYSPNPNQTRQEFFTKLVGVLYSKQEALVVEYRGYRYIADAFTVTTSLSGNIYQDITVNGESVPGVFRASDVLHFTIEGERIQTILNAIASAEGQLLKTSSSAYVRNSGRHGVLHVDELAEADPDFEETYSDLINEKFRKYFTAENAVLPLFNGYTYDEQAANATSTRVLQTTRDIRALMDDIVELTAQALGIPASIGSGKNVTEADFKTFMTSPIQPLVKQIESEINRKLYGQTLVFSDTYIVANLGGVRYTDLFDVANPIDKLIGSGAFCVNDIRTRLGLDVIDEPWAWQHWMTKNYSSVEDLLTCVDDPGGGVENKNTPENPEEKEVNDE